MDLLRRRSQIGYAPGSSRLKALHRLVPKTQDSMQNLKTVDFHVIGTLIELIDS